MSVESLYALTAKSLQGQDVSLARFAGKVTLVVNVASECGFTPQYAGLEKLHQEFSKQGFSVLGFPSNEFGAQEPGSSSQISAFCEKNYGVTFPMFEKVVTKPGPEQSPVYALLGQGGHLPSWNFAKYLVDKDGKVIGFYPSKVLPDSTELVGAIVAALSS